uniref:LysM and putative peptidoglycan-binding domain-containing protein 1 n=1 Tax=Pavo cristatus TaxID=9049 RepID=A0A8C9G6I8_PAVCR
MHRQHLQRVEDGAVRAHRAGVSAWDEPQSGWSPTESIFGPSDGSAPLLRRGFPTRTPPVGVAAVHLPLLSSSASSSGMRRQGHRVGPGDTLPGLALRYGVTMEQIKRANRLYTSDTIFLKPTLLIPPPGCPNEDPMGSAPSDPTATTTTTTSTTSTAPPRHDLTASDFLRRLDADIGRSKAAVVEQRLRAGVPEAAVLLPPPGPSLRGPQLGAQPLTRTRRAAALRDTEDEIFML